MQDRDVYLLVARLLAQNPHLDFHRVYFDTASLEVEDRRMVKYIREVFPKDRMPELQIMFDYSDYRKDFDSFYDRLMDGYREKWNNGELEIAVTRVTNLAKWMEKERIPHILFQPCPATIMEGFLNLLHDIEIAQMEKSLTACCVIRINKDRPTEREYSILKERLEKFNSEQNMVFVLRRDNDSFEAVTSRATVQKLTSNNTTCFLTSYLYEVLPFSTHIGWGIGYDIVTAHKHARLAIRESVMDPHHYTYLVNEEENMVGPLCGDRTISYQIRPDARTIRIANELGIAAINLQKILSLQKNRQMKEFSASDLVFYLDITPRSATRILKKLVEHGAAVQINRINLNGRGRPTAIYEIDLDKIE
ncbi:MAG: hypothetical protein IIW95_07220, partial [Lachnospiraceae bacterium]|nr:hypothetical protein [Lachnospiraceae bacterium]